MLTMARRRRADVDHQVGDVQQALPDERIGSSERDCATEVTAMTRRPRAFATSAISTGSA